MTNPKQMLVPIQTICMPERVESEKISVSP